MLKVNHQPHIDGNEFFQLCEERCYNVEGQFNESYCPAQTCSICFYIPNEDELEDNIDEDWEQAMVDVLLENGFHYGDSVYIDVDY